MHRATPSTPGSENPPVDQLQALISLYSEGNLQQALLLAEQLLLEFSNSSLLHNLSGAAHAGLGQFDAAIASYRLALEIEPGDAKTHFNLGIALNGRGKLSAAIASYQQALNIAPDYVLAYINMGNALKDNGDLLQAIQSYEQALRIDPNFPEVYCNLGNALKDHGDLKEAIASYEKALQINPDYAQAHNNMGSALKDSGELGRARESYLEALRINPDYVAAAWNGVGIAESIAEAHTWLERCLAVDPNYLSAKLQLAVLDYFSGDQKRFDDLKASPSAAHPVLRSLDWVSTLPKLPSLYFHRWAFFDAIVELCNKERPFYEFGVFRGAAFKYLIQTFKTGYGFDTFAGLPEDWREEKAGAYSSEGRIPEIAGGEFIAGRFEESLPVFFSETRPLASLINFDADLYSSTLCALNHAKSVIDADTVLIFDEFIVNENWEEDEYRALNEFCSTHSFRYEVLAVSFFTKQVAVRLLNL